MADRTTYFSKKVALLNAIATVLIVVLHSETPIRFGQSLSLEAHPFIYSVFIFCQVAIPLFFFISALLFYRNCEWKDIPNKLYRRIFSLLVPFILWNLIFVIIYWGLRQIPFTAEKMNLVASLDTPKDWLSAIWHTKFTPLWFVKYLIFFCLMSPAVLLLIKNKWIGIASVLGFLVAGIILKWDQYCNLFYWAPEYLSGALVGRYFHNPTKDEHSPLFSSLSHMKRMYFAGGFGVLFLATYTLNVFADYLIFFRLVMPLIIWFGIDFIASEYIGTRLVIKDWFSFTFFIYATHHFLLNAEQALVRAFLPATPLVLNLTFVITPIITLLIIIWTARWLSRYKFYKVLTGGR